MGKKIILTWQQLESICAHNGEIECESCIMNHIPGYTEGFCPVVDGVASLNIIMPEDY